MPRRIGEVVLGPQYRGFPADTSHGRPPDRNKAPAGEEAEEEKEEGGEGAVEYGERDQWSTDAT